jgi:hypothetical protein
MPSHEKHDPCESPPKFREMQMGKRTIVVRDETIREIARIAVAEIIPDEDNPLCVEIKPLTRTLEQNAKLWAMLDDISKQVIWYGHKLKGEEWKHVFTASLKKQKTVPGIDGGFVVLGTSTSTMGKKMFSDLIELIYAFGAEHEVEWSDEAKEVQGLRH